MTDSSQESKRAFEEALEELEEIAKRMEEGKQTLEQSLMDFERGMNVSRECQKQLQQAEQRVLELTKKSDSHELQVFETDTSET